MNVDKKSRKNVMVALKVTYLHAGQQHVTHTDNLLNGEGASVRRQLNAVSVDCASNDSR